jgi:hypothetical protein
MSLHSNDFKLPQVLRESGDLHVPWFQRDYEWDDEHIDNLFRDIFEEFGWDKLRQAGGNLEGFRDYFMGTVVLCGDGLTRRMLLDGQQRLTTLTMLYAIVLRRMNGIAREIVDFDALMERCSADLVNPQGECRVQLKPEDHPAYAAILKVVDRSVDVPILDNPALGDLLRDRALPSAYIYLRVRLEEVLDEGERAGFSRKEAIDLVRRILTEKVLFVSIRTDDEDYAIKLFETLNARGEKLKSDDLIKNALFLEARGSASAQDKVTRTWNTFAKRITDSADRIDFLRYYWNAQRQFIGKSKVYINYKDWFRKDLAAALPPGHPDAAEPHPDRITKFCNNLEFGFEAYKDICAAEGNYGFLRGLRILNAKICRPLLLAAFITKKFEDPALRRACVQDIARICESAMHRCSVGDQVTNSLEHGFQRAANKLMDMCRQGQEWPEVLAVMRGMISDPVYKVPVNEQIIASLGAMTLGPKDILKYRWRAFFATLDRYKATPTGPIVPKVSEIHLSYIVQGNTPAHQSIGNIQVTYRDGSNNVQPAINPPLTELSLGRWTTEKMRRRTAELSELACQAFALGGGLT